jgi:hypothetical protein
MHKPGDKQRTQPLTRIPRASSLRTVLAPFHPRHGEWSLLILGIGPFWGLVSVVSQFDCGGRRVGEYVPLKNRDPKQG